MTIFGRILTRLPRLRLELDQRHFLLAETPGRGRFQKIEKQILFFNFI